MRSKALTIIMLCFLITSSFVVICFNERCKAAGNEIFVDDDFYFARDGTIEHPYGSIQYAIDMASEGDTIYVFGGTYNESFSIDKDVTLIGSIEDGNTIVCYTTRHDYTVEITADFVTLEGFNISDTANKNRVALVYVRSDNVVIQGNNITHSNTWGIYLDSSDGDTLGNNIIDDAKGIYLSSSNNNVFSNNYFNNCDEAAIKLVSSNETIIYNNDFHNSKYAILAQSGSNNNISKNTIGNSNIDGIKLYKGSNNTVLDNAISNSNANGINLDSFNSIVKNNMFHNNQIGINLVQSNCNIIDNTIHTSRICGIYACSGSKDNLIYLNDFADNAKNSQEMGDNQWYYETQGNYWDDYNEVDRDLNGIGDTPYAITGGGVDLYPLGYFLKPPSRPTSPSPSDGAENIGLSVTLRVTVSDPDSSQLEVYFYRASDDELYGVDYNVRSGGTASCSVNVGFITTFTWYAIVNDSKLENQSNIWYFTTKGRPPENEKPVADTGGPYTASMGQVIVFNASGSYDPDGDIDFYRWNFGDGTSEILDISPTHSYSNPGTYEVVLTVIDNNGTSDTATTTVTITVPDDITNQMPVANAGGPYSGNIGGIINFNGSYSSDPDGDITNYTWDFGDGANGAGQYANHTYSKSGTYAVRLTVTDSKGANDSDTINVEITAVKSKKTPGYELIFSIIAILLVLVWRRRK